MGIPSIVTLWGVDNEASDENDGKNQSLDREKRNLHRRLSNRR
jgi:hypothetical protein